MHLFWHIIQRYGNSHNNAVGADLTVIFLWALRSADATVLGPYTILVPPRRTMGLQERYTPNNDNE